MPLRFRSVHPALSVCASIVISANVGCAVGGSQGSVSGTPLHVQGVVHGGQQPVSGAAIQLYAVGATDGGAATPMLTTAVSTGGDGSFSITGDYTCPASPTLVYLAATGGNPGLSGTATNPQLALLSPLGLCSGLTASTTLNVDELTTVSAVFALAPYVTNVTSVGALPAEVPQLANGFALATELVNNQTGVAPGTGYPSGVVVPVAELNTLADILSVCVNSGGGIAGDKTPCGNLFTLATPAGGTAPTDTVAALVQLAGQPSLNTQGLFNLLPAELPFQPVLTAAPNDFSIHLNVVMPTLSQVAPTTLVAGSGATTLDLHGANFVTGTTVFWNQTALTTQVVSSTELTAAVPASLTAGSGNVQIVVLTPGGGTSSSFTLPVTAAAPTLTLLSPQAVSYNQASVVTLTGTGFVANSVGLWNGVAKPTSFVNATTLQMTLAAADTQTAGANHVAVMNAGPGGGTSSTLPILVTGYPIPAITSFALSVGTSTSGCSQIQATITGTNFMSGATNLLVNGQVVGPAYLYGYSYVAYLPAGFTGMPNGTTFTIVDNEGGQLIPSNPVTLPANSTPLLAVCAAPANPTIYANSDFRLVFSTSQWNATGTPAISSITAPSGITTQTQLPLNVAAGGSPAYLAVGAVAAGTTSIPYTATLGGLTANGTLSAVVSSATPPGFYLTDSLSSELGVPIGGSRSLGLFANANSSSAVDYTVELSASGLPPGTTATFVPARIVPGDPFTITVTAAADAPMTQNTTVTVTGTPDAAGVAPATINILVDVTPPPGSLAGNRSDFVSTGATPYAIAYQRQLDLIFSSNPTWNRIDVLSNATHKLLQSISVPTPTSIDLSQDGSTLWIGTASQQVYAMNTQTLALTRYLLPALSNGTKWQTGALFVMADGTLLLNVSPIAGGGSSSNVVWTPSTNALTAINAVTYAFTTRSGDGTKAYGNYGNTVGDIYVYSAATKTVSTLSSNGGFVIAANQDGSKLVLKTTTGNPSYALYGSSLQLIGNLPTTLSSSTIANPLGGFVFSPDGGTLYQIGTSLTGGPSYLLTMNTSTLVLEGTAPAIATVPTGVSETPIVTQIAAVDNSGILIGIQNFGVGFDDSTFFQAFAANTGGQNYPVSTTPNNGPLSGGTVSSPYGSYSSTLIPDVWYGSTRGSASVSSNSLQIVSPASSVPGPVNLKYIFPSGAQVFTPEAFSYSAYPQYAILAGAGPNGGVTGEISGYGLPANSNGGTVTVGGALAPITTQTTQYPAYTGEPFPSTFLNFTIPAGTPGYKDLQLTTPSGTGTLPKSIFYAKSVTDYGSADVFTDVLYDSGRNQVYLSAGDHIDVFSLTSNQFVTPLKPASNGTAASFRGLALTTDGTELLAANMLDGSLGVIEPDMPSQTFAVPIAKATGVGTSCAMGAFAVSALANGQAVVSTGLPPLIGGCPLSNSAYIVNLAGRSAAPLNKGCSTFPSITVTEATSDGTLAILGDSQSAPCLYAPLTNMIISGPSGALSYTGVTIAGDGNVAAVMNTFSDASGNGLGFEGRPQAFYSSISGSYPQNNSPAGALYRPRLNAAGSLYYWAFPHYFEIVDVGTHNLQLRFSLAETVQNVETPIAIDAGGQKVFLITSAGLTIVDLGMAPLSIGHVTPSTGSVGAQVTVRGSGFISGCTATVGGQTTSVTFVDQNTLTMGLPALASGSYDMTITNPDGTTYTRKVAVVYP